MVSIDLVEEMPWNKYTIKDSLVHNVPQGWEDFFESVDSTLTTISDTLHSLALSGKRIWPKLPNVFNAFYMCRPHSVRAGLVGKDVYHQPNVSYGISFSSYPNAPVPSSLKNVYKKLEQEGYSTSKNGYLGKWANEGVFLINTSLTVTEGIAGSHMKIWAPFTKALFKYLQKDIVWILWGNDAQIYRKYFVHVIIGSHPSGLNRTGTFLVCNYFRPCNEILKSLGKGVIDWNL